MVLSEKDSSQGNMCMVPLAKEQEKLTCGFESQDDGCPRGNRQCDGRETQEECLKCRVFSHDLHAGHKDGYIHCVKMGSAAPTSLHISLYVIFNTQSCKPLLSAYRGLEVWNGCCLYS